MRKRAQAIGQIARLTYKRIIDPFYAGGAAEVAFFLIMSLVPATILLAQLLNLFTMSMDAIKDVLGGYLSDNLLNIILPLLDYSPHQAITFLLILLALWAGSSAIFSLMRISNHAYHGFSSVSTTITGYLRERTRAILLILLVLFTLIFALYILVFGEVIVRITVGYINEYLGVDYSFSAVWYTARWIIAFILFFLMVFSIYYVLPSPIERAHRQKTENKLEAVKHFAGTWIRNRRKAFFMALPGSIFAAASMLASTGVYTAYVQHIAMDNFNILYGGLSSIIVLLIWFFVMSFLVILGIQINAAAME
ncbi:MAG: YihY/virulence factor BrkB family protein [Clostridiales Family XIII bacterium]|jgi:membrane protein|nr:YihY/virulence factor BrkB family protein [Clostridiales Family XIII bacterium]